MKKAKLTAGLVVVGSLQACAGLVPWVQQHAAEIAAVSTVAGAVATTENAVINTITLEQKLQQAK